MKIIAHRGASAYAPENTLKAFSLAVKMGAVDFEFDVHQTRDGILVVHHDFDLKRTAGRNVKIADLDPDNVGKSKYGVEIWDGRTRTEDLVEASDVVLLTGTTLVNGTFDAMWGEIQRHGKEYLIYGVTTAGVAALMGLNRICFYGRA